MALDFRASQFRGAKFIASGSTGTGARIIFYDIANDNTSTPNSGEINTSTWNQSAIGTDVFLFVSGTVVTGSSAARISAFGGSVFVSGALGFGKNSNYIQTVGNDLKFYDGINPQGYTLSQLASSSTATGSSGGGSGSLQSAYLSGNVITLTASVGPVRIIGDQGAGISGALHIAPSNDQERAICVYDNTNTAELLHIHGLDSTFGGAGINFRSRGDYSGYIGWSNVTADTMDVGAPNATIYYHDSASRLILREKTTTTGKVVVWNESIGEAALEFQNTNPGFAVFFASSPTSILANSGTLRQSGVATFSSGLSGSLTRLTNGRSYLVAGTNVTIVSNSNGSVTISSTASGSGGATNQRVFMAGAMTTVSTQSVMAGQIAFNSSDWTSTPTAVYLRGIANVINPPHTASFRLFNLTSNTYVTLNGTSNFLSVTASNPTIFTSSNIYSSLSSSNIFELRISSSLSQSYVSLGSAEMYVVF